MSETIYILVEVTDATPVELAMSAIINSGFPFEIVDIKTADKEAGEPMIEFP